MHLGWQWCFWSFSGNAVPNITVRQSGCYYAIDFVLYGRHSLLSVFIVSQQSFSMPGQVVVFHAKQSHPSGGRMVKQVNFHRNYLCSCGLTFPLEMAAMNLPSSDLGLLGPVGDRAYHSAWLIQRHFYYKQPILLSWEFCHFWKSCSWYRLQPFLVFWFCYAWTIINKWVTECIFLLFLQELVILITLFVSNCTMSRLLSADYSVVELDMKRSFVQHIL